MKKLNLLLPLVLILTPLFSCSNNKDIEGEFFTYNHVEYDKTILSRTNEEVYDYSIEVDGPSNKLRNDFAYGVDISTLEQVIECGGVFYNQEGKEQNVYEILKENGVNFIRVRLWNDPYYQGTISYGAGHNDLKTDLKIMKEASRVGLNILLDFHYSDFWADPGVQTIPKAWQNSQNILKDVYDFTYDSLSYFKDNSIDIDAVQLGNEISYGLLWPYGKIDYQDYDTSLTKISNILKEGIKATKMVFSDCETIVHLANPHEFNPFIKYLTALENNQVDYDIIGVTNYPYWQGAGDSIYGNVNYACQKFNKPCMIVETSYGYTLEPHENANHIFDHKKALDAGYEVSYQGQVDVLDDQIDLLSRIENNLGLGIFYWEPCWLPVKGANAGNTYGQMYQYDRSEPLEFEEWKNGWANQALFSFEGRMLPSLGTYKEVQKINAKIK